MFTETFSLTDDGRVKLTGYLHEHSPEMTQWEKRPTVLVLPGGAYLFTSDREADPIALQFLAAGFNAFVLRYSVKEYSVYPAPLAEASRAVKIIRDHAQAYHLDPDKIAVCGFSAGGHLAASLGTLWNDPEVQAAARVTGEENRPDALVLCYPASSIDTAADDQIWKMVAGERGLAARIDKLDCPRNVGKHTPPTFLFHTFMDNMVPVENSLLFAGALAAHDIPFEMHIFQDGPHGLALANGVTDNDGSMIDREAAEWMRLCTAWLSKLFGVNGSPKMTGDTAKRAHFGGNGKHGDPPAGF